MKNNVKLAAVIVMIGIMISRVLGYVRETLIANTFMGNISDAFYSAFLIPDFMFNLLIGGTLSAAFIPIFTSYLAADKEEEGWRVASNFINILALTIFAFALVGIIFAPFIMPFVAYKFTGEQLALTIRLTRIMFTSVAFLCLAGLHAGILNTYHRFTISQLGPVAYNLGIILSIIFFGKRYGIEHVAYGVVASALIYFLIQVIGLKSKLKYYKFIIDFKQEDLRKIINLAIPSIIGLSINQLNPIITQNIASGLGAGSISALRYANIVMWLPIGIFAAGISIAIFPTLTRQISLDKLDEFKSTFSLGIRTIIFVTIPCSIGLIVLREPVIRFLFKGGQFKEEYVGIAAGALLWFAIGIAFQSGVQLITRGFYCIQDTKTPVKVGFLTILINIILNIIFVKYTNFKINGLALSTSISYIFNMIALIIIYNKKIKGINIIKLFKSSVFTFISSSIMGIVIYISLNNITFNIYSKIGQLFEVLVLVTIGAIVFMISTLLFKMEEAYYFINIVKNKLKIGLNNNQEV